MGLKQRFTNAVKRDRATLKTLSFRGKVRFFFDYYRWTLFLLVIFILLCIYLGDLFQQSRQTIDLQGFFINDRQNLFPAEELMEDFSHYQNTPSGHRIAFEDSLLIDLDSGSEYHAASQSKLMAYIAARQLDFLVAPKDLAQYYAQSFSLMDLKDLLPQDLCNLLEEDLSFGEDGTGINKAWGLNLRRSRFLQNPVYDHEEDYYLLVLSYTPHTDALISFIRYAYGA